MRSPPSLAVALYPHFPPNSNNLLLRPTYLVPVLPRDVNESNSGDLKLNSFNYSQARA